MPMPDDLNALRARPFAEAVEKLEKMLLAGSSRVFLIGAGCSKCAGLPLMADLTQEVLTSSLLDSTTGEVLTAIQHLFDGSADANIEDYLSEIVDLLAIADRRSSREAPEKTVSLGGKFYDGEPLRTAVDKIKEVIAKNIEERNVSTEIHQKFVRAVHRPKRAGMSPPTRPVDYLVLNYDTVLEDALALECVPFADGLDGGVTGWWSPQTFKRDGLAARIFKLHGSINWFDLPNDRRSSPCPVFPLTSGLAKLAPRKESGHGRSGGGILSRSEGAPGASVHRGASAVGGRVRPSGARTGT